MDDAGAVGAIQPLRDRLDQGQQAGLVELLAFLQHLRERFSALEIHHDVGRAVDLEEAADADDVGMPLRLGQLPEQLGLLQELLQAQAVDLLRRRITRLDRLALDPVADRAGEILLDGDLFAEIGPPAEVDDAEAADPQHLLEPPLAKHGTLW